jgi:PAS domain S-box-containing protein
MRGPGWKSLLLIGGLLALLTCLFCESRGPDLTLPARLYPALQAFETHDAELTRDVLLSRAGMLPHDEALVRSSQEISGAVEAIQRQQQYAAGEMAAILGPPVEALANALRHRALTVEAFTSDNALLRNAYASVLQNSHAVRTLATAAGQGALQDEIDQLSLGLLRFLQRPEPAAGNELRAVLDRLAVIASFPTHLPVLVAQGRLIVELLPRVDAEVLQILAAPTTVQARALREILLRYDRDLEAQAQRFTTSLYGVAVLLLGYLGWLFTRLRAHANDLHRANAVLRQEMAERQQAEDALRVSEARLYAITDAASEAIISSDWTGSIVFWNAGATAIFGYSTAEALGMPFTRLIPPQTSEAQAWAFHPTAGTDGGPPLDTPVECIGRRKDGSPFPLALSLSSWTTAEGRYVTGIIRDLTASKRIEEHMRQQALQLIQANKMTALGTLVSGVAHEINNPNQLILTNAQVLASVWRDAVPILDVAEVDFGPLWFGSLPYTDLRDLLPALMLDMQEGARHIERIINDLKSFARPPAPACHATFQLNEAVQRAARLITPLIRQHTKRLQMDLAQDLPPVLGDRQQVEQIIVNLLVNALEALPDTERGVTIVTGMQPEASEVALTIQDEGLGIAPEHLAQICEPFFTTKQAHGGTGLGLAITAALVRAHGGSLSFASKPSQGTRVQVLLPCRQVGPSAPGSLAFSLSGGQGLPRHWTEDVPGARPGGMDVAWLGRGANDGIHEVDSDPRRICR